MLILGLPIRYGCLILTVSMALAVMTGCESTPKRPHTEVSGTSLQRLDRFAIEPDALKGLGYRIDWRSALPLGADARLSSIDAYDDIVIVQTADTLLSVLDTTTGSVKHSNELSDTLTTLVGNVRLEGFVVSCTDGEAFFINPGTGDLVDRQSFDGVLSAKPTPLGPILLANTNAGVVLAHTSSSGGFPLWRFGTRNPIDAPVALAGNSAVIVTRTGRVVGLEATSGLKLGENSIFMGPDGCDPVASENTVYIASPDQSVYAFDAFDLSLKWRVRTAKPLHKQITLIGSVLYVPTEDRGLLALDAATGKELWNAKDCSGVVLTLHNDRLVAWADGRAWSVNASDGVILGAYDLPGITSLVADHRVDGSLYAVSKDIIAARLVNRR